MAIDTRLPLAVRGIDTGAAFKNALQNVQGIRSLQQIPLRNELLQAQTQTAQGQALQQQQLNRIRSVSLAADELLPDLKANDIDAVRSKLLQRKSRLVQDNAANNTAIPTNDTDEALATLEQPGGIQLLTQQAEQAIQIGQRFGVLKAPSAASRDKFIGTPVRIERDGQTFLSGIVQRPDGSFTRQDVPLEGELVSTLGETAAGQVQTAIQQAGGVEAAKLEQQLVTQPQITTAVETAKVAIQLPAEERKQLIAANTKRLVELSKGTKTRSAAAKKAGRFLRALQKGEAQSGATRSAAGFIPGVFSSQAQFDEEFNSFAEVAAREKLKAVGEIRPTDADVEGMKRALFGVGRDETTNINLLQEFISEQQAIDDDLDDLREAKRGGRLDTFTGGPVIPIKLEGLSNDKLLDF